MILILEKNKTRLIFCLMPVFILCWFSALQAQEWKWLRVGEIQCRFSSRGAEVEIEGYGNCNNFLSWPAQYGTVDQVMMRQNCMWIGCKDFYDTRLGKELGVKVIGIGPRESLERMNMIFEKEIKLIGKTPAPVVEVDGELASDLSLYDEVDEYNSELPCDRMIVIKINTSIGVSVTKKILAFSQSNHNDYFIYDFTFKNTGIINEEGDIYKQRIEDVYFYFAYRYAFSGESLTSWSQGWGANTTSWGANTLNHAFGNDPSAAEFKDPDSPYYQMRAFYAYYSPDDERPVPYEDDWGCPNQDEDGVMSGAKLAGNVTLHADTDVNHRKDDLSQPVTTWYVSSDEGVWSSDVSQSDELYMQQRYEFMSEGDPEQSHAEMIADNYLYAQEYEGVDIKRNVGGGSSQGQGYGPYDMDPGDSIRIVFAQGISGLSREKNREVGLNWIQYYLGTDTPELVMPDGSVTSDYNEYKNAWVFTGIDSVIQTYRNAINLYQSGYSLPEAPPPPEKFTVASGGDRIMLSWSDNAATTPRFNGYRIYRSEGSVMDPEARYTLIYECDAADAVHSFEDVNVQRGFDYYYAIVSRGHGAPNAPVQSGLFWTMTNRPAYLRSPDAVSDPKFPEFYSLEQNFPNPFNPETSIRFSLSAPQSVNLVLYDRLGRQVKILVQDDLYTAGTHTVQLYGEALESGLYVCRIQAGAWSAFRKLIVVK